MFLEGEALLDQFGDAVVLGFVGEGEGVHGGVLEGLGFGEVLLLVEVEGLGELYHLIMDSKSVNGNRGYS